MKSQLKKYFPLTIMLLLLILVVSMMPQEGAADKAGYFSDKPAETTMHVDQMNMKQTL